VCQQNTYWPEFNQRCSHCRLLRSHATISVTTKMVNARLLHWAAVWLQSNALLIYCEEYLEYAIDYAHVLLTTVLTVTSPCLEIVILLYFVFFCVGSMILLLMFCTWRTMSAMTEKCVEWDAKLCSLTYFFPVLFDISRERQLALVEVIGS